MHRLAHRIYVDVDVGAARVARTREVEFHPTNPVWNQSFRLHCAYPAAPVAFTVKSQHLVGAGVLGAARVPAARVATGEPVEGWLDLRGGEHGHATHTPKLRVRLRFLGVESDPWWDAGVRLPGFAGVTPAFFPERSGCRVTLYQNSHLSGGFDPGVRLAGGGAYRPARLWEDMYVAIRDARRFVYVAGWSVNAEITLVRDASRMVPGAEGVTLGELLRRKADEGVAVLVMPWQDKTSVSFLGNGGLMRTHDEETQRFFEGTNVRCFLCPRNADASLTMVQSIEVAAEFTHHQKTVTLDAAAASPGDADGSRRHIVSFIGGIDLCDGRYDDENHTLFRDLDTTYRHDFMQNNFKHAGLRRGGPREPWHDVHCRLEGRAAWDVLANFEQRWRKQAPPEMAGCLLDLSQAELPDPGSFGDDEPWNVQVFRSIDDASVVGFPAEPVAAAAMGLTNGKDVTIDRSIQAGYVEAIRRARRFIYVENQYFLGGCASWAEDRDAGCLNLVPVEIALKVAAKIRRGERFAAYVVTPMWPEGEPAGDSVQAILRWNRLTVEMMYGIVTKAIDDAGLRGQAHPCDYLNFFCLGNREAPRPGEYSPPETPDVDTDYWRAQVNRRFPIYVHAKLMIGKPSSLQPLPRELSPLRPPHHRLLLRSGRRVRHGRLGEPQRAVAGRQPGQRDRAGELPAGAPERRPERPRARARARVPDVAVARAPHGPRRRRRRRVPGAGERGVRARGAASGGGDVGRVHAGHDGGPAGAPAAVPDHRVRVRRGGRPDGRRVLPGHDGAGEGEEVVEASRHSDHVTP